MARLSVRSSIERRIERELERAEGAGGRALLAKERAAAAKGPLREILCGRLSSRTEPFRYIGASSNC